MSATPTLEGASTATRSMLRNDSAGAALLAGARRPASPRGLPQSASSAAAALVEGASKAAASRIAIEPRSACSESALRSAARRSLRLTLKV